MKYLKNADLIKIHRVSDKAVRNWVEGARSGKNKLELFETEGRFYIVDSLHNDLVIEELVQRGRKYRNRRNYKRITPTPEFYALFNERQINDIANSLDKYSEIPSHYRYFGRGSAYWNAHLHRFYQANNSNMLTATIELLNLERGYFASLLKQYNFVNIIDLGVGNGLAAKDLVQFFYETGKLKRYVGIDCSKDLLDITERNIKQWFNNSVCVEKYVRDFGHERFMDILNSDSFGQDASETINVILFLGGTIGNFREPTQALHTIRNSMGKDDILITSDEFDSESARKFYGSANLESFKDVYLRNKFLLDLLSVEESFYKMERTFDERINSHLVQARLKVELSIEFRMGSFKRTVNLHKDDPILLFRMWEWTSNDLVDFYEKNGFSQLRTTKLRNQEFVLLISQVNTGMIHPLQN